MIIVGASSFSGQVQGRLNQFHLLEVEVDVTATQPLRGTIETWSWSRPSGWLRRPIATEDEGFPPACGFGSSFQPRAIVKQIEKVLGTDPDYIPWQDVVAKVPDLQFMTPSQFRQVESLLESININLNRDREGRVSQVGRAE